ncbi:uncharacterized protein LOC111699929 [Eurytemora carolleeae]|uniref:uncharacterized protein LOC111699929 n=1 Tax=Eurytemora carolleeae TaxID=1294199 RepID=UPI000C77BD90|nr:uncharacterized protein LOC111699929 [Eurytemora carolleeae]|eukprot:XP_023326486.1 uncharacterized protein LOC111699929 [Eurytemora affinis]
MNLFSQIFIQLVSVSLGLCTAQNTVYGSSPYTNTTLSRIQHGRYKRAFNNLSPLTLSSSFSLTIPLTDLATSLTATVPFSFNFPTASTASGRSLGLYDYGDEYEGRSFGSIPTMAAQRKGIFDSIESYLNRFGGVNGASCLERAICEVAATPDHDDGILGDAMNLLLKVDKEAYAEHPQYAHAQQKGEIGGDCSEFHRVCPVSIFSIIDTFQSV